MSACKERGYCGLGFFRGETASVSDYYHFKNICVLQKYLFTWSSGHCMWDWCFSLTCYIFNRHWSYNPSFLLPLWAVFSAPQV